MSSYTRKYLIPVAVAGALTAFTVALPAFVSADTGADGQLNASINANVGVNLPNGRPFPGRGMGVQGGFSGMMNGQVRAPGIAGTVTSISGSTITVTSMMGQRRGEDGQKPSTGTAPSSIVYTVDASAATFQKGGVASTLSAIAVGDRVMVLGTVSGTSITAKTVIDGMPGKGMMGGKNRPSKTGGEDNASTSSQNAFPGIQGNGQPIVGGTVTAISGSTLTITNASNVTYTVNASAVTVTKGGSTTSLSNVAVGDNVIVQGAVSGNAITASTIIDSGAKVSATSAGGGSEGQNVPRGGFLGGIGSFFKHLFGF